jgi:diguanylate cyclase (GGDEF)-like protein
LGDTDQISILIVDDDVLYLETLKVMLSDTYVIHTAQNGHTALMLAEDLKPDVVLLDVVLPGMTGFDVFFALRENESTRYIPVILMSGLTDMEEQERVFVVGAADFMQKPCSKIIIREKIKLQLKIVEYSQTINQLSLANPLTGLPGQKRFLYTLNEEYRRNCRNQTSLSLVCLNIDDFTAFNHEHGYSLGDEVLKKIAAVCRKAARRSADIPARLDNGTFAVCLSGTDDQGARIIAENIKNEVAHIELQSLVSAAKLHVSITYGLATRRPSKDELSGNMDKIIDDFLAEAMENMRKV